MREREKERKREMRERENEREILRERKKVRKEKHDFLFVFSPLSLARTLFAVFLMSDIRSSKSCFISGTKEKKF